MFKTALKIAIRNSKRNFFYFLLNVLGLAIGLCVFLHTALYVHFEKSYEDFIPGRQNIYRVGLTKFQNGERLFASAENYPGVGPALKTELPEVVSFARLYNLGYKNNVVISNESAISGPVAFKIKRFLYADSSFLPMMQYPMKWGSSKTALAEPYSAVLSGTYARKFFGRENPIGKMLRMQDDDFNNELVKVTGVFEDLPGNTHLKFDVLFSYKTLFARRDPVWASNRYDKSWTRKDMYTFIRLRKGADPRVLVSRLPSLIEKYKPELKANEKEVLTLQPVKDIHLYSDLTEEPEPNGNGAIVFFLQVVGLFVLGIAWINYINLSTARALERAKEVGIRKVSGSTRGQLMVEFMTEASLNNFLAVLLAALFVLVTLPFFNSLSGLCLPLHSVLNTWFFLLLLWMWLIGTFCSGFYPSVLLSSFKPILVVKGKIKGDRRGIALRKGLVVFQFVASIVLITGTIVVYRQLRFMMNSNIGIDIEQVVVLERPGIAKKDKTAFNSAIDIFRNELKADPSIESISSSLTVPGKQREYKITIKNYSAASSDSAIVRINTMDYDFIHTFKMKLLAGRNFSKEFAKDEDTSVLITERVAKLLGYADPTAIIGKTLSVPEFKWNPIVAGVVNDYHQLSLKKDMDPTLFTCSPYGGEYYSIRIKTRELESALKHIRNSWVAAFPGNPFDYFFLDEYFNQQYSNEQKFGRLFTVFALLSVLISCIGLFGLSSYMVSGRMKEIGIRKVLGASVMNITSLLTIHFLQLVAMAFLIAIPLAWWMMNYWLNDFAYRISLSWWIFPLAGCMALIVALLTISIQSLKAAVKNPVNNLRTE